MSRLRTAFAAAAIIVAGLSAAASASTAPGKPTHGPICKPHYETKVIHGYAGDVLVTYYVDAHCVKHVVRTKNIVPKTA